MDVYEKLKKYKDVKEIYDILNDIENLDTYYNTNNDLLLNNYIDMIMSKYPIQTYFWNSVANPPKSLNDRYLGCREFLCAKGVLKAKELKLDIN